MTLRVLAFDTSSDITAVAVSAGSVVLAEMDAPSTDRHEQTLLPRIQSCLTQAGLALWDIDLFGVGIGPGSFTGVRVGLATAKGFALATGKPVRGVVSLASLAQPFLRYDRQGQGALVLPVLDGYKGEVFTALYACGADGGPELRVPPFHASPALAAERIRQALQGQSVSILGSGFRRYAAELQAVLTEAVVLDAACDTPHGKVFAQEALRLYLREGASELAGLVPIYLRDSDAQLPKSPLRL